MNSSAVPTRGSRWPKAAHLADVCGAEVSKDMISRITDAALEELTTWQSRPLDELCPLVFVDATHVKIRDGARPRLRPVCTAATEQAANDRFPELAAEWGKRHSAIIKLCRSAWPEVVPFLAYSPEIRTHRIAQQQPPVATVVTALIRWTRAPSRRTLAGVCSAPRLRRR